MPKLRFTEPFVRNVTSNRQKEFCEDGLCLRVYATGRKVWFLPYRTEAGRFRRLKLGTYPAIGLKQARSLARSRRGEVEQGQDPQAERIKTRQRQETFGSLATIYLERHAKVKKRSWMEDERILNRELLPVWADREPATITRREIADLVEKIVERGSPIMANRTLALIGKVFSFAIEREIVEHNPRIGLSMPAKERARDRALTDEEIQKLWSILDTEPFVMASIFRILLLTAQRSRSVMTMRKEDLSGSVWSISEDAMKSQHSHRVFLSSLSLGIIQQCALEDPESPWVFPSSRKPGTPIAATGKALQRIRRRCGFHFTCHDLRRTCATHLSRLGCPRHLITLILDHADASVTGIYDRYSYEEELREWMERWGHEVYRLTQTSTIPA